MFSGSFERLLSASRNRPYETAGFTPALDLDGNPIPGTSTGMPVSNKSIPGMDIGNMQGLLTSGAQTSQLFPIIKQKIPAVTLDGGKTYFDPRDGSPIDMNSLQPKDFFTDFGQGIKAIKEAKEQGGTYMNEETRKMLEMLEGS